MNILINRAKTHATSFLEEVLRSAVSSTSTYAVSPHPLQFSNNSFKKCAPTRTCYWCFFLVRERIHCFKPIYFLYIYMSKYIFIYSTNSFCITPLWQMESWENSSCGLCNWLECLYCPIAYCRIRWQFYAVGWISSWNVGNVHPIKIIQERKRGGEESQIVSQSGIECSHYAALQSNQECKDGLARKV